MNSLPIELVELILSKINDTETHKNARCVCKQWYTILKNGKIFLKKHKFIDVIFDDTTIIYKKFPDNKIIAECFFTKYGSYTYKKYNNGMLNIEITSFPFNIKKTEYNLHYKQSITYDILKDKKSENVLSYAPACLLM